MKFIGIIPARYASTRFPGKPLAKIGGVTMIERVYRQACKAIDEVVVATDDERIFEAVEAFGGRAIMTSTAHKSGTDRCHEAYIKSGSQADVVINIQGDEPFIDPSQIETLKGCFDDETTQIATLIRRFDAKRGLAVPDDPNTPKVVVDNAGNAMYFSRSVMPFVRDREKSEWYKLGCYYTHVGVYAFRAPVLAEVVKLRRTLLEIAESLEQLRWLQNGYRIKTAITECPTIGIDTPADLEAAEQYIKEVNHGS